MLFYLNQFELHLPEASLKKGLNLHNKFEVHPLNSPATYTVKGTEIRVQLKNNQLQSYHCSCNKSNYCEHLAAVLFFLQDQQLHLPAIEPLWPTTKNKKLQKSLQLTNLQELILKSALLNTNKKNKVDYFKPFLNLLKSYLKPYSTHQTLDQTKINLLHSQITQAQQLIQANNQAIMLYEWHLALYCFYIYLNEYRFSGHETPLLALKKQCELFLNQIYFTDLDASKLETWLKACLLSLHSNKHIKSKGFYFLCSRYILISKKNQSLQKIEESLSKRKYVQPYDEAFNFVEITQHFIQFKYNGIPKKLNLNSDEMPENTYVMALCEYYFLKQKPLKAFDLLDDLILHVKSNKKYALRIFTEYAIQKSKEWMLPDKELHFLRQSILYNYQLNDSELNRFTQLLPPATLKPEINQLLIELKKINWLFTSEKHIKLLLLTDDYDALLKVLIHEKNKFNLFHQTALKLIPSIDVNLLTMYAKQLSASLQEANTYTHQKQLIHQSKDFFSALSSAQASQLLQLLINQTGYQSQIAQFILNELNEYDDSKN